jgi:multisubunit Na+/H+ antiporter MnhG subunit
MPEWPVRLLALAFLLPALTASIDALARTRRRREPVSPWLVWLGSALLPFVLGLALALVLVLVGLARDAPPAPLDPRSVSLDTKAVCSLIATGLAILLAWILGRSSVIRRAASLPDPSAPGAACVTSLGLCVLVLALVLTNPFAALLLVPAVHLWMLGTMTDATWRTGVVMYLLGLVPLALVAAYYMVRLDLGPFDGAWYLFLLVTGNQTGVFTTAALVLLAGITGSVGAILLARARHGEPALDRRGGGGPPAEPAPSIFGPGGHAGPGAIGQARSTLER